MQLTTILLSGLGLIALASNAPVELGRPNFIAGPITFWRDTKTLQYHCEGRDIIRCERIAGGACLIVDTCESYCFLHDKGAACVDMGAPPVADDAASRSEANIGATPVPKVPVSAKVSARAASSEDNEHNECSKDRTGVLICRYGFCSIDYYCKAGDECQDGSFTCAPKSPSLARSKSGVRDVPRQTDVAAVEIDGSRCTPALRVAPAFSSVGMVSA
ncbi:hypothetical protein E8E12_011045 [Didymella heteroderae]|uniref:Uncharacterized protein n=1 Tax=Didymella heteroderae TaxID=1769908 RepID=A0A9P5C738_9PLEO|nr:hypothetical protein E8E12_011045 [Didymella heteroderae]